MNKIRAGSDEFERFLSSKPKLFYLESAIVRALEANVVHSIEDTVVLLGALDSISRLPNQGHPELGSTKLHQPRSLTNPCISSPSENVPNQSRVLEELARKRKICEFWIIFSEICLKNCHFWFVISRF